MINLQAKPVRSMTAEHVYCDTDTQLWMQLRRRNTFSVQNTSLCFCCCCCLFFQTPVDFRRLGSEYVLSDIAGLISNELDSTASGVLINNPAAELLCGKCGICPRSFLCFFFIKNLPKEDDLDLVLSSDDSFLLPFSLLLYWLASNTLGVELVEPNLLCSDP